jgi:hypothetical protein
MDYKPTIWVNQLPDWKTPCPCGGKRSGTKDMTTVYCKECKQNWKISKFGLTNDPSKTQPQATGGGYTRSSEPNGMQILTEHIVALEAKIELLTKEIQNNILGS